ncbi:MAG: hypothetical protein ACREGF_07365 [Candidatus Saccharimonadales bacterium]
MSEKITDSLPKEFRADDVVIRGILPSAIEKARRYDTPLIVKTGNTILEVKPTPRNPKRK